MERARRMILRDIERGEIVEVVLDLRSRGNVEPGATEQGLDPKARARHRVQPSRLLSPARKGHIDATLVELALDVCAPELRATRLECALQLLLRFVDARTGRRPLAGRNRAERLELLGEGPLLAEPAHARLLERAGIGAGGDFLERLLEKGREIQGPSPQFMPRAVFACWAMAPKAAVSCTAISASTLRSICTPALFSPLMMRL